MQAMELLTPWFTFVVILLPTLHLERWIHQHLYGVGWLLFPKDRQRATILYYLILLPGVFLHEFTQWLVAGALKLKTSKIKIWPKPLANGTLRLDFVRLSGKNVSRASAAVFETAPLIVGVAVILFISQRVLEVDLLLEAFKTADLGIVQAAFGLVLSKPDFWLWLYLLFAVGNAMVPTENLNLSWLLLLSLVIGAALLIVGLIIPGSGIFAVQAPLANALNLLATAASTILVMDLLAVVALGLTERLLERITHQQARYPTVKSARPARLEPGGEAPLPEDQAPARIADRRLPIPPPPARNPSPRKARPQVQPPPPASPRRPSWIEQHASDPEEDPEQLSTPRSAATTIDDELVPEREDLNNAEEGSAADSVSEPPDPSDEDEDDDELTYVDLDDIA